MTGVLRQVFSLLDARERRGFWLLNALMVLVALAEVGSVSAVLVLLQVLAAPQALASHEPLMALAARLGLTTPLQVQVLLAVAVTAAVAGGLAVKAFGGLVATRYAYMRGQSLSTRLLGAYLRQPYGWFLERNSADIGKNVLAEVDGLIVRVLHPLVRLLANAMLVVCILGFLMLVDPVVTVLAGLLLGGGYALVYLALRGRVRRAGADMMAAYADRFRIAQEATGGIREIKLMALEAAYLSRYRTAARRAARATLTTLVMADMPRHALEAITFGTLLSLVLVLLLRNDGDIAATVPTLGIFALSVMRLLPALQQIYHGLVSIRGAGAILDQIAADHAAAPPEAPPEAHPAAAPPPPPRLGRRLELRGVTFRYPGAARPALAGVDMVIEARSTVGIVGGTGAGKTTLVDLILGLHAPQQGAILADGTALGPANLRAWQRGLGYVPQTIYLTDDTVAANIAFGIPRDRIDRKAVERAARAAALQDVVAGLPQGLDTLVGERGLRLSGGQRQRIGIARALYRNPALLILDEATSALDTLTEGAVMQAVDAIRADTTVILIAHRLGTVRGCDRIFLLEHGRIAAQGRYEELVAGNATFRAMARGG